MTTTGRTARTGRPVEQPAGLFRAPRAPRALVPRTRLYPALDAGVRRPLTLVVAPPGTGKTMLVLAWLGQASAKDVRRVWWENCHKGTDLSRILLRALGMSDDELDGMQDRAGRLPAADVFTALEQADEGEVDPDLVVLDDAHQMTPDQIGFLDTVLSTRPDTVRLVLATRRDLPLPIFELELHGQVTTLRAGQIRFAEDEAKQLIGHHLDATPEVVRELSARADGWAAALVLGARTLEGVEGIEAVRAALGGSEQPILDFLLSEAFQSLSAPIRSMLLSTFEEPHLTASRAETLTGRSDSGSLLASIASDGLLVTAYPGPTGRDLVYRYHPLLVGLLNRRTAEAGSDMSVSRRAHRRAALEDASKGRPDKALRQAIAARDEELIARMILDDGPRHLVCGDTELIREALSTLPEDILDEVPALSGVIGLFKRLTDDPGGAVMLAARAGEVADSMSRQTVREAIDHDAVLADGLVLQLWKSHFGWEDLAATIETTRSVVGCAPGNHHEHRPTLVLSPERQAWLMNELAMAEIWAGELDRASIHIDEAIIGAQAARNEGLLAMAWARRSLAALLGGNARVAGEAAEEAIEHAGRLDAPDCPYTVGAELVLCWVSLVQLDLERTRERRTALRDVTGAQSGQTLLQTLRRLLDAWLLCDEQDADAARQLLTDPIGTSSQPPEFLSRMLASIRWWAATSLDDPASQQEEIVALAAAGFDDDVQLLSAIGLVRAGDHPGALEAVDRTIGHWGHPAVLVAAQAVRTAALLQRGEHDAARAALVDLLSRAARHDLVAPASLGMLAGPAFISLLADEANRSGAHPFAETVLTSIEKYLSSRTARLESANVPAKESAPTVPSPRRGDHEDTATKHHDTTTVVVNGVAVTLTLRELDVLQQLALGSSYNEIGLALYITENTVKTHLASLYRKLAVERKSAALRVARELGLL